MTSMHGPFVFFGSGPVAEASLRLLLSDFTFEVIVTKPATGNTMRALCPAARVFEVKNRTELDKLIDEQRFASRCAILIDFGVIVSQRVIDTFPMGIINSHFSLLPEWRGADPITFAILSGQSMTGVSLMLLVAAMDEGPLLAQSIYRIADDDTTPSLTTALVELSAAVLKDIVPAYLSGSVVAEPQLAASLLDNKTPTYSRRLTKEDGKLDWNKPALQLEREIRAFAGWPKSFTKLAGRNVIISRAALSDITVPSGEIKIEGKRLYIGCKDKALEILRIKPEGKSEMPAEAFLAGYKTQL